MIQKRLHAAIAFSLLALSGAALAQTAVDTGVPPPPATLNITQAACDKPATSLPPGRRSAEDQKRYDKQLVAYRDCVTAHFTALGNEAKAYAAVASQLNDAGNKEIQDFNAFAAEVRKNKDEDDNDN